MSHHPRVDSRDGQPIAIEAELRAAVTSLRLLVEGMNDGIADATRGSHDAAELLAHVRRLSDLVGKLGAPADEGTSTPRPLSVASLLRHWVAAMGAGAGDVAIEVDADPDLPLVRGDARQLSRVVLTLLDNAIHQTPPSEVVRVRVRRRPEGVLVQVEDVRSELPVTDPGLAPARAIVEAHGGRLWIAESAAGGIVCFSLPALAAGA